MGLFNFFKQTTGANDNYNIKDARKAECPYCNKALEKIPAKKTECPFCRKFMYVRTRPKDNARVVVTKSEAEKIEEDWAIVSGTHDSFVAEKEKIEKEREILKKRFGKDPSENDVRWGVLNKSLIEQAQHGDWGLYRNTRFEMAEILRKEMKFEHALQTYLEVCYIDLNGPNNTGGINDKEMLKEFPPFDPKQSAFLAPGVVDLVERIMKKLELDKNKIKSIFIKHNSRIENSLRLPLSAEDSWHSLEKEIKSL